MSRTTTAIWVIFMGVGGVMIRPPLLSAMSFLLSCDGAQALAPGAVTAATRCTSAIARGGRCGPEVRPSPKDVPEADLTPGIWSNCSDGGHSLNALSIEHGSRCRKGLAQLRFPR